MYSSQMFLAFIRLFLIAPHISHWIEALSHMSSKKHSKQSGRNLKTCEAWYGTPCLGSGLPKIDWTNEGTEAKKETDMGTFVTKLLG